MFARQSGLSGNAGGSNLVEFRAGRMNMIGKMVHPDTRKGLVYLTQSEDGLMHFCWKDRTSGKVEDDLIVFPDDFEFKRVEQCKTGRVFVLKFKSSSRRMFFWMQEPKTDKDEEHCRRVNELMNNPPSATRGGNDSGDLQYMLNNMSQQQLMQLFGGVGQMGGLTSLLGSINRNSDSSSRTGNLSTRSGNTNSSASLSTPESNSAARTPGAPRSRIGSRIQFNPTTTEETTSTTGNKSTSGGAAAAGATSGTDAVQIDLSAGIAATEAINVVTADPDKVNQLAVLLPQTEDNEDKKKQIKDTIASPQFQQALSIFSNALQTAQLGPVVSHFELTPEAVTAAYAGNLEDFIKALEKALPPGASMETSKDEPSPQKMEHSGEEETKSEKQDKS